MRYIALLIPAAFIALFANLGFGLNGEQTYYTLAMSWMAFLGVRSAVLSPESPSVVPVESSSFGEPK